VWLPLRSTCYIKIDTRSSRKGFGTEEVSVDDDQKVALNSKLRRSDILIKRSGHPVAFLKGCARAG
jgi:hypothetical protein